MPSPDKYCFPANLPDNLKKSGLNFEYGAVFNCVSIVKLFTMEDTLQQILTYLGVYANIFLSINGRENIDSGFLHTLERICQNVNNESISHCVSEEVGWTAIIRPAIESTKAVLQCEMLV